MENAAFAALVKYGGLVLLKTIAMSPITIFYRMKYKSFPSPEDAVVQAGEDKEMQRKLLAKNDEVERARSAHMNDIENVVPFVLLSLLFIGIQPDPSTASFLFKVFAGARVFHTVSYLGKFRQPCRGLSFAVGMLVNSYMAMEILKKTFLGL